MIAFATMFASDVKIKKQYLKIAYIMKQTDTNSFYLMVGLSKPAGCELLS